MQSEPSEAIAKVAKALDEKFGYSGLDNVRRAEIAVAALDPDFATRTHSPTDAVEAVARALCSLDIRAKRRHDTDAGKLTAMLPAAVDYAWPEYVNQAKVALTALPPSGEVERLREALAPFAAVAEKDIGASEDDGDLFRPMGKYNHAPHLTVGHLRAALAALRNSTDGETK